MDAYCRDNGLERVHLTKDKHEIRDRHGTAFFSPGLKLTIIAGCLTGFVLVHSSLVVSQKAAFLPEVRHYEKKQDTCHRHPQ
ncbi:MAG: hypothetical protein WBY88_09460, partial [Desulfosarcina sp.]